MFGLLALVTLNLFTVSRPSSNVTCTLMDRSQARSRKIYHRLGKVISQIVKSQQGPISAKVQVSGSAKTAKNAVVRIKLTRGQLIK